MKNVLQPPRKKEPRFKVIIADECHYLKNRSAQRTKELLPLLANARRAILLSGTPALSRPKELWTQLNVVDQNSWDDQESFLERYCTGGGGSRGFKGKGKGAANLRELHELLKATVMVRRCKKDILKALPPKRRTLRPVEIPEEEIRNRLLEALQELKLANSKAAGKRKRRKKDDGLLSGLSNLPAQAGGGGAGGGGGAAAGSEYDEMDAMEIQKRKKCLMMEAFKLTGIAKAPVGIE